MSDEVVPLWKRNFAGTKAKGDATKRENRSLREDMDAVVRNYRGDPLGRQAALKEFYAESSENRRAFWQARVRLEPQEVRGHVDHEITVKVVTQLGEKEIIIDDSQLGRNLKRPPKDARTGEVLEVVPEKLDG